MELGLEKTEPALWKMTVQLGHKDSDREKEYLKVNI